MRPPRFVDLEVTSHFTFLTGASSPEELVGEAAALGAEAVAIADRCSLAGVVRAHEAAQHAGIRLVVGARLGIWRDPAAAPADGRAEACRLHPHLPSPRGFFEALAFPSDRAAYGRLSRLITRARRRAAKGRSLLFLHDLLEHGEGLQLVLVPPAVLDGDFIEAAEGLATAFGGREDRLSMAIRRIGDPDEPLRDRQLQALAARVSVPLVATNDVHWHRPRRRRLQDVLACMREGVRIAEAGRRLLGGGDRGLQSHEAMRRRFPDLPAAVDRSGEIAARAGFSLSQLRYEYPHESVPDGLDADEHLRRLAEAGAAERYPRSRHPAGVPKRVRDLLGHELALIRELGYARYFLTVHEIVRFARSRGILCQGRGAAANSAVCYCLGVTAVDPQRSDMLFERFISRERNEPPDIDIDFEHERREEVIQHVYQRYGRERAALAAEVVRYRGRSSLREVGKVLGIAGGTLDRLAAEADAWSDAPPDASRLAEAGFDPDSPLIRTLLELAGELAGFPRHLSQHVGGFVITEGPLCEIVPIENAAMADRTVIEWDKDDLDAMGMLKIDLLSLGMLSAIRRGVELVNHAQARGGPAAVAGSRETLTCEGVPAEDPAVYEMLCRGDSVGVFQVESRAQMSMLPRLRPRCFYDLVIEVAIVRPGPIQGDMVHPYLRRRRGEETVSYPDEAVRQVLERTLGVPLFQEQAMALSIVAAGFTPGEADRLRRALAAWKRPGNAIEEFRRRLLEGMAARGYAAAFAEQVFERIRGFSGYGFPESHAASFALLVYVSAWLKRHHPAAFTAALLDSQPMGFYAPAQLVRDARDHGVRVRAVDALASGWRSRLEIDREPGDPLRGALAGDGERREDLEQPAVRLGMSLVRGLSQHDAEAIAAAAERERFESIESLALASGVGAGALRRLAEADAFASMGLDRSQAIWQVRALGRHREPLFESVPAGPASPRTTLPPVPRLRKVAMDYRSVGLSIREHPLAVLRPRLRREGVHPAASLGDERATSDGELVSVAGLVICRQRPSTANGIVFITLEDESGIANLIVRPKVWQHCRRIGRAAVVLMASGRLQRREGTVHLLVRTLADLSDRLGGDGAAAAPPGA